MMKLRFGSESFGMVIYRCKLQLHTWRGGTIGNGSRNCATCGFWFVQKFQGLWERFCYLLLHKVLAAGCRPGLPDPWNQYFNPRPCILEETAESGRFVSLARCCCNCRLQPFRGNPPILPQRTSHTCICSVLSTNRNSLPPFGSARYTVADW
jgi:hypothetical protein